jgi:peptidyl-prolyl cis-trans isomerase D
MLEGLRANKGGIITWIFLGAIIIVFVISFGPGSLSKGGGGCGGSGPTYAARVNGKTIPALEWERQYGQLVNVYRAQMGNAFTRELAAQLGLGEQALSQLVDRELVVQEAHRRGLVVSDDELSRSVQSIPAFQQDGAFRFELYEESAKRNFGSPAKFEAWYRDQLLYGKMLAAVEETVKVSDGEARSAWQAEADKVGLVFVRFPLAQYEAEAKPTDAEVKAFADKNGDRIQKFYEENAARFDQKAKARVRHVLARVAPGADDAAARKKIDDAAQRVKKGEDFAKVASALSDDAGTKAKGGELGFISEGLFDETFAKAALALKPGQVSEPVKSAVGWHLIQAEEVVPAKKLSLDQARPEIARELLAREKGRQVAQERAQAALAAARSGKKLGELFPTEDAAKKAKASPVTAGGKPVVAEETGTFSASSAFAPKLGAAPELVADALRAKPGDVLAKVYETPAGPVVAAVTARETPDPKAFDAQREAVTARLRSTRGAQVVSAWLESLRKGARIDRNAALLAQAGGIG